jgi:lysyl-tRNA synthetase class 2
MTQEDEQIAQRRAHLAAIAALGLPAYPHRFDLTDTVSALAAHHEAATGDELEASPIETTTAGRILAIRSFGKASFLAISDGRSRIQV